MKTANRTRAGRGIRGLQISLGLRRQAQKHTTVPGCCPGKGTGRQCRRARTIFSAGQHMTTFFRAMTFAATPVLLAAAASHAPLAAATDRTVYVMVTDSNGAAVTDLAAADLTVKEGGKEREVTKVVPASTRMRLTLAVEERLIADSSIRMAIFEFLKRLADYGETRMITIGLRNTTVADYTSSLDVLVGAINKFTLNPSRDSNVAEGVLEIADHYAGAKVERPVLIVLAMSGGQAGVEPRTVLDKLRQGGVL